MIATEVSVDGLSMRLQGRLIGLRSGQITGNFTVKDANDLSILLRAGALRWGWTLPGFPERN